LGEKNSSEVSDHDACEGGRTLLNDPFSEIHQFIGIGFPALIAVHEWRSEDVPGRRLRKKNVVGGIVNIREPLA
jgi:hypothetical protein